MVWRNICCALHFPGSFLSIESITPCCHIFGIKDFPLLDILNTRAHLRCSLSCSEEHGQRTHCHCTHIFLKKANRDPASSLIHGFATPQTVNSQCYAHNLTDLILNAGVWRKINTKNVIIPSSFNFEICSLRQLDKLPNKSISFQMDGPI